MASISLISKILRGIWLIDKQEADGYLPLVMQLINGQTVDFEKFSQKEYEPYALSSFEKTRYNSYDEAPKGSIAIIPLQGALEKNDYCGVPGTASLAQRIESADSHANIIGTILLTDSPGGHVVGIENLFNTVKSSRKPVIGFVEGIAASAAYWAIAGANEIILSGETAKVGSIGTYATIRDFTKHYEEKGIKVFEVYATESTEKNKAVRELIQTGKSDALIAESLDPINNIFMDAIRSSRNLNTSDDKILKGKVYLAQEAITAGLADKIGNLTYAMERIEELSKNNTSSGSNSFFINTEFETPSISNQSNSFYMSKIQLTQLTALSEKLKNGEKPTPAEYAAVQAEFSEHGLNCKILGSEEFGTISSQAQLAETVPSLNTKIGELQGQLTTSTARVAELEAQIAASATPPANVVSQQQQALGEPKPEEPKNATHEKLSAMMKVANEISQ